MFEFLNKKNDLVLQKQKTVNPKEQLKNVKTFAERILDNQFSYDQNNMHSIFSLVKILSDKIVIEGVLNLIKTWNTCHSQNASLNFFMFSNHKKSNYQYFPSFEYERVIDKKYKIHLATCPVITIPWERSRLENAVSKIATATNVWQEHVNNHSIDLYLPMGVSFVWGGNHSIFSGILKSQGELSTKKVCDITEMYKHFYFDGNYYRRTVDDEIICKSPSFEFGCIFEIGRLISNSKVKFLEVSDFGKDSEEKN